MIDVGSGPENIERTAKALRREAAKRHHPDLGGDADEFIRAMRTLSPSERREAGGTSDSEVTIRVTGRSQEPTPPREGPAEQNPPTVARLAPLRPTVKENAP